MAAAKIENYEIIGRLQGADFEYMTAQHPFLNRESWPAFLHILEDRRQEFENLGYGS